MGVQVGIMMGAGDLPKTRYGETQVREDKGEFEVHIARLSQEWRKSRNSYHAVRRSTPTPDENPGNAAPNGNSEDSGLAAAVALGNIDTCRRILASGHVLT